MDKSRREKIALLVFCLLAVLSLGGLGWYILAGHSWNVAASTIDDTVGEMDGYTAIVFGGTTIPAHEPQDVSADRDSGSDEGRDSDSDGSEPSGASSSESGSSSPSSPLASDEENEPVDVEALCDDYEAKGAAVLSLDISDLSCYQEGAILKRGGKRIGVLTMAPQVTQLDAVRCLEGFERADVDFTVVVAPYKWKIERLSGIDIAICAGDEGIVSMGQSSGGCFYVDSPEVGKAGVVLVSPSNVVSAKEVSEI